MKKSISCIAFLLGILLIFAGCKEVVDEEVIYSDIYSEESGVVSEDSSQDSSSVLSASSSKVTSSAPQLEVADKLDNKNVTIMWIQSADQIKSSVIPDSVAIKNAKAAFEKKYGGKVSIIPKVWDDFNTYLATTVANGESPDVVVAHNAFFPNWAANKLVMPLDSYINAEDSLYNKKLMDMFKWNGKYYALFSGSPKHSVIVYNKALFAENGVPNPMEYYKKNQWNWDTFVNVSKTLTKKGSDGQILTYGFDGYGLFPGFINQIAPVSVGADGKPALNWGNSKFKEGLERFYNFYQVSEAGKTGWDIWNANDSFPKGKTAMIATGYDMLATWKTANQNLDLGIIPMPSPPGSSEAVFSSQAAGWAVSAKSKNPKGAVEFIKIIFNEQAKLRQTLGDFYSSTKYMTADELQAMKSLDGLNYYIYLQGFGQLQSIIQKEFAQEVVLGKATKSYIQLYDTVTPLVESAYNEFMNAVG